MRDVSINLRAHSEQRDLIDRAAESLGKNRSDFMLEAACEKAQGVMLERTFFAVGQSAFEKFAALLEAPVAPNPALESLLARKPQWES